jgi:hypothetical protein
MALAASGRWREFCCDGCQPVKFEGFSDALGGGGSDALVDRERLLQAGGGFAGIAVLEMAVADAFQSACFLDGHPDVASDDECLLVTLVPAARD